ncbi:MAG: hypothetical protein A2X25_00770 [Chloroflexi bacterium GWB2_49_20]|nr:MAG: hypothetical protein A2X25_00770 [Chloroflexi bacterium GWB2_49_20]OGN77556.1 MAG: hypothetical protein A2X26_02330 [Chloroflexi bacterium GWC2_49_37]OGN83181.1 MAG: hypothetical protein A2X27_13390 [Chloroflexi bacterium GWD2_49_16]
MTRLTKILHLLLTSVILLSGCAPTAGLTPTSTVPAGQTSLTSTPDPTQPRPTPEFTSSPTPDYSPTPDLRLKPEQWQDWPIIPEISPRAIQIYEQGLALGNDLHAFSKVGDCQSIPEAFLGIYDKPGQYDLTDQYQYLQETIDYYAGSFGRESQSVRGGFNAASVLLPLWADPNACSSGETPLECEIRLHKPSMVIVSLEVWYEGRSPETYAGYTRQIIEYAISRGVLPILVTKADNMEGDNSINLTVAQLAYEYDIPMWNFWRAVQPLTDHGIDWARDSEGFHITVAAWNMRSFTALQVLDALRRRLAGGGMVTPVVSGTQAVQTPDPAFTPAPAASLPYSQAQPFTTASESVPDILFDLTRRGLDFSEKLGIYRGDMNGTDWYALASAGYSLLDISADGTRALMRFSNELYSLNLADASRTLLTDQLVTSDLQPAFFLPSGQVAAILKDGENFIYLISTQDATRTRLSIAGERPIELIPARYAEMIYWNQGSCDLANTCTVEKLFSTGVAGGPAVAVPYLGRLSVSSDGTLAFLQSSDDTWNDLTLVKGQETKNLYVPGNRLIDMAWSPDGSTLALSTVTVSDYSGKITENFHTLVTWPGVSKSLNLSEGKVTEKLVWSPDGKSLLVMRRVEAEAGYGLNFNLVDINSNAVLPGGFSLTSGQYLGLPLLFWLER